MKGFGVGTFNIMYRLIFKRRVDHDSDTADEQMQNVQDAMIGEEGFILTFFPFMWPIMKYTSRWQKFIRAYENLSAFFEKEIRVRQERLDTCEGTVDFYSRRIWILK